MSCDTALLWKTHYTLTLSALISAYVMMTLIHDVDKHMRSLKLGLTEADYLVSKDKGFGTFVVHLVDTAANTSVTGIAVFLRNKDIVCTV